MASKKKCFGFDFGTESIRIYRNGLQACNVQTNSITAIKRGAIANMHETELLLRKQLKVLNPPILKYFSHVFSAIVSTPFYENPVMLRAYRDILNSSGAYKTDFVHDCIIVALGLGFDISSTCSLIVDCGAGKTSITTMNKGTIVETKIFDIAGNDFNNTIQTYISKHYNATVDFETVETLKKDSINLDENAVVKTLRITAKEKITNGTKTLSIPSSELNKVIRADIELIIDKIVQHFENSEIDREAVLQMGIHLVGGSFKMKGFIPLVSQKIKVSEQSYSQLDYKRMGFEKLMQTPHLIDQYCTQL